MRTLLYGGTVHDGLGNPPQAASVIIERDQIQALVADSESVNADIRIDCTGLEVVPGFVNSHGHLDFNYCEADGRAALPSILQGITTETIGLCGQSAYPLPQVGDPRRQEVINYLEYFLRPLGIESPWSWSTTGQYIAMLQAGAGINVNVALLVGHSNLRLGVMGYDSRPAERHEIAAMKRALAADLEQGAIGMSTGLQWAPAFFASNEEIRHLADVCAEHEGIYATHMRAEGDMMLEALSEAIEVAITTGVSVHVSHLKAAGKANWGKIETALCMIDQARSSGANIAPDKQPYTTESMGLRAILPPWAITDSGGIEQLAVELASREGRDNIELDLLNQISPHWKSSIVDAVWDSTGPENIFVDGSPRHPDWEGKSLTEIARVAGGSPWDIAALLLAEGLDAPTAMYAFESETDLRALYEYPHTVCATDFFGKRHPRNTSTFPRFLGRLAQQEGWLDFDEALRRITSLPAERLRLHRRGILKKGYFADVVVLDRRSFVDTATYSEPMNPPTGIVHVLVNGELVVRSGKPFDSPRRPGRVVSRK